MTRAVTNYVLCWSISSSQSGHAEPLTDREDLLEDRARHRVGVGGADFGQVAGDIVGARFAVRCGEPAVPEADEDAGEPAAAGRVVLVRQLAGAAGQERDDGYDEVGIDDLGEPDLLQR